MQSQKPSPMNPGISDVALQNDPGIIDNLGTRPAAPNTVKALAYGGNDPGVAPVDGRIFRMERGYPYKRNGHFVPVMPQFKALNVTMLNLGSQPNANRSVAQIVSPTADPNLTNTATGTPFIGWPGYNAINLT